MAWNQRSMGTSEEGERTATKEELASACKRVMKHPGMVQIDIRRNNP
jgi:hypothetical protein